MLEGRGLGEVSALQYRVRRTRLGQALRMCQGSGPGKPGRKLEPKARAKCHWWVRKEIISQEPKRIQNRKDANIEKSKKILGRCLKQCRLGTAMVNHQKAKGLSGVINDAIGQVVLRTGS